MTIEDKKKIYQEIFRKNKTLLFTKSDVIIEELLKVEAMDEKQLTAELKTAILNQTEALEKKKLEAEAVVASLASQISELK